VWSRGFDISLVIGYKEFADVDTVEPFYCVDIGKFFIPYGETGVKPTRRDITLRLREWEEMKKIDDFLHFFPFP